MNISDYIKETKGEMKYVNWPSRQQAVNFTILVVVLSVVVGVMLGLFDSIFTYLLKTLIFG